uniref:Uncharacterized protein n=1 Tax=Micrurus lemniscatus lemniscatus TaxID=129467 RepID=A0A2D4IQI6_MICLE
MIFRPNPLMLAPRLPLMMGAVTTFLPFTGWLMTERGTVIRVGSLPGWEVETTVVLTGTCRTVEVPGPIDMGVPAAPETTATALETEAVMVGRETAELWPDPDMLTEEEEGICLA